MDQLRSRRRVLAAFAGAAGGLAGCQCLGAVDCRVDSRVLEIDPEPLNPASTTTPATGGDGAATDSTTPRATNATEDRQESSGGDRWYPRSEEPWVLELTVQAEYVRTDEGTFEDVSVTLYDDDGRGIDSVEVGPVTVDNGFERYHEELEEGCCPGGEVERFYGRTETVAVDRFPRHVVASARDCRSADRLSVSTFEAGGYYDRRYGCGETPRIFDE